MPTHLNRAERLRILVVMELRNALLYHPVGSNLKTPPMRRSFSLASLHVLRTVLAAVALFLASSTPAHPRQSSPDAAQAARQPHDSVTRQGPFVLGNQRYSVNFQYKVLPASPTVPSSRTSSTLSRLEILDARSVSLYYEELPYHVSQGRLQEQLTASASLLTGNGGVALAIRFVDHPQSADKIAKESWQLFTVMNDQLKPLGPMLPLGHGSDITVGGVVTAVMMKGGIAVMPMASTAEVLALRVWTGNFYASVPVRFDWAHGQWGVGQQCYRNSNGTLTESGCILPVQASAQPRSLHDDFPFVQLFPAPDADSGGAENIMITPNKPLEFLEMFAIVHWHTEGLQGQRVACTFSDVWLRTRIDGQEGWVHGQDAFAALGLPQTNPAP